MLTQEQRKANKAEYQRKYREAHPQKRYEMTPEQREKHNATKREARKKAICTKCDRGFKVWRRGMCIRCWKNAGFELPPSMRPRPRKPRALLPDEEKSKKRKEYQRKYYNHKPLKVCDRPGCANNVRGAQSACCRCRLKEQKVRNALEREPRQLLTKAEKREKANAYARQWRIKTGKSKLSAKDGGADKQQGFKRQRLALIKQIHAKMKAKKESDDKYWSQFDNKTERWD